MTNTTERRWGAGITAGLAVLALIAGACGGGGEEAAVEDAPAAVEDVTEPEVAEPDAAEPAAAEPDAAEPEVTEPEDVEEEE